MICPHCGAHRQIAESLVGKIMAGREVGGLCPNCNKRYEITRENIFEGDPEYVVRPCKRCGARPAERGLTICIDCWSFQRRKYDAERKRKAVEKEREERSSRKPGKLTLEEKAARAQAMGLSYGKYEMLRNMGKIKEE